MLFSPIVRHLGRTLLFFALAPACVATNPDWDESPVGGSSGESAAAPGTGSSSDPEPTTDAASAGATEAPGDDTAAEDTCLRLGLARCENGTMAVCADLSSDPVHCGTCFRSCAEIAGSTCIDGECACPGGEWWAVCGGACRDVRDDPQACGHACVDCTRLDDDDPQCKNGECEFD